MMTIALDLLQSSFGIRTVQADAPYPTVNSLRCAETYEVRYNG